MRQKRLFRPALILAVVALHVQAGGAEPRGDLLPCAAAATMSSRQLQRAEARRERFGLHRVPAEQGGWVTIQALMESSSVTPDWAVTVLESLESSGSFFVRLALEDLRTGGIRSMGTDIADSSKVELLITRISELLRDIKNDAPPLMVDPDVLTFALFQQGRGPQCVETWSPDPGTEGALVLDLAMALRDFASGETSEKEFWATTKALCE